MTKNRLWSLFFSVWLLLLSGVFTSRLGPPGILQAVRLHTLHLDKQEKLKNEKELLEKLQADYTRLKQNRFAQAQEIRKVLGYAGKNELIFDFRE